MPSSNSGGFRRASPGLSVRAVAAAPAMHTTLSPGGVLFGTTQIGGNQGCNLGFGGTGCATILQVTP
jgi:hypothetical protein